MVKALLMPKWEQQCAKRVAHDQVAKGLLPMKEVVRIAICQDGRRVKTHLTHEGEYFKTLYNEKKYLNRKDIRVECYEFSFSHPHETLEYHHQLLNTTDIFYMTGTTHGHPTSDALVEVFKKHAFVGPDERDQSDVAMNLFRAIKRRVQYNDMVFMGVCGGAMLAGKRYWCQLARDMEDDVDLFDFFMGVSVHYDANLPPESCDTRVISERIFQITGGAALAVHIENDIALAKSFPCLDEKMGQVV